MTCRYGLQVFKSGLLIFLLAIPLSCTKNATPNPTSNAEGKATTNPVENSAADPVANPVDSYEAYFNEEVRRIATAYPTLRFDLDSITFDVKRVRTESLVTPYEAWGQVLGVTSQNNATLNFVLRLDHALVNKKWKFKHGSVQISNSKSEQSTSEQFLSMSGVTEYFQEGIASGFKISSVKERMEKAFDRMPAEYRDKMKAAMPTFDLEKAKNKK